MLSTIKNIVGRVVGANDPYNKADAISKKYADAINTQYAAGIQNLQDQKKGIAAAYDPHRASVNAQYERGVRNANEQMANLGLTRSGTNLTQQMALETERQRGMAEVNTAQAEAAQNLQAQINQYMAERDAAIGQQAARLYENTYNMQQQFKHDEDMAALNHRYNQQMAVLQHQHNLALATNNHALQLSLEKEMAALEQDYRIATLEKQAELDNASYAQRAATDWNYQQKQMALADQYERGLVALRNSYGDDVKPPKKPEDDGGSSYQPSADARGIVQQLYIFGLDPESLQWRSSGLNGRTKNDAIEWLNSKYDEYSKKGITEEDWKWIIETAGL